MIKSINRSTVLGVALALFASLIPMTSAGALSLPDVFSGPYRGEGQPAELFNGTNAIIPKAINLMLFIVGVLAIFMMIYGGIRYVLSGGDNSKVKDAKNTILYAIVGLVVAILGYAIVNWVVQTLGNSGGVTTDGGGNQVSLLISTLIS